MANRNKKVIHLQNRSKAGMMDQAVKDIMEVSEDVVNQLEMKRGMMQTVLDTVESGFEEIGLNIRLRLAQEGYDFLFSDIHDYLDLEDEDDDMFDALLGLDDLDDDDDEPEPIEMFSGEDDEGNDYSVLVMLLQNEDDEDSFDMNIAVVRETDGRPEVLTDAGWEAVDLPYV